MYIKYHDIKKLLELKKSGTKNEIGLLMDLYPEFTFQDLVVFMFSWSYVYLKFSVNLLNKIICDNIVLRCSVDPQIIEKQGWHGVLQNIQNVPSHLAVGGSNFCNQQINTLKVAQLLPVLLQIFLAVFRSL